MKRFEAIVSTFIVVCLLSACGGSKQVLQSNTPTKTKILLDECQELQQQKPEARAWGEGISFSLSSASNAAELQARSKFARAVASKIKACEGNESFGYRKSSTNTKEGATVRDEGAATNESQTSIAEAVIKNAVIVKTSQYMMQDGAYQVFVCLEYKNGIPQMADEITENVKQRISDEDRIKMQYEFQKFRERIEKELNKMNTDE